MSAAPLPAIRHPFPNRTSDLFERAGARTVDLRVSAVTHQGPGRHRAVDQFLTENDQRYFRRRANTALGGRGSQ